MKLYVVRHGETLWNAQMRVQGRSDIDLNECGIKLAEITGEALKDLEINRMYSSPLIRAYHTARIIRGERNIEIIKDDRLKEISFGEYEGRCTNDMPEMFNAFFNKPEEYVPPKGGETFTQVIARASDFIYNVAVPASREIKSMMVVAHGCLNNGIAAVLMHREIKDYWEGIFPRNCSMTTYDIEGENFKVEKYGEIFYGENEGKRSVK